MTEHWADKEIKNLKDEKNALLDQKEREDIWHKAFSNPEEKWRFKPAAEELIREKGFNLYGDSSFRPDILEFKRRLLIGACEYLQRHPPADNRITVTRVRNILKSSRVFGHLIANNANMIDQWITGVTSGFDDIVVHYGIDVEPNSTINDRYVRAIRKWWRDNPKAGRGPYFSEIAKELALKNPSPVSKKIQSTPELSRLMEKRPDDL